MNPDEIKLLVEKRGLVKAALTRINTALEKFDIDKDNINQLKSRLSRLKITYSDFDNIQIELELKDVININKHNKEREEFENKYFDVESAILTLIDENNQKLCNNPSTSQSVDATNPNTQVVSNVRLPRLNLPTFEGHYTEWMTFYDTFRVLIHESSSYSNVEKFHYLRSCLRGDAFKSIESIAASNSNYQIAWDALKKRYENKRLIVQEHVCAILNSPIIHKATHTAMRQLVDDVAINTAALKALDQPVDSWDGLLIPIIVQKFDYQTKKEWESTLKSEVPTFSKLKEFLETKCALLASLNASNKQYNHQIKTNQSNGIKHNNQNSKFRSSNCLLARNGKPQCPLCSNNHPLFKCKQFCELTVMERINKVDELKLCTNCFRNNHKIEDCKSNYTCRKCNENHNTLLHKTESIASAVSAHTHNNINTSNQVLLCTAQVLVKNNKGEWINCRALLDVGSQSNFISENVFQKLQLPSSNMNISINGVNESASIAKHSVNIELKSMHNKNQYNLKCLVLPKITDELPTLHFLTKELQIPTTLPLADPQFNTPNKIDILLGAGIFWSLLRAGQIPGTQQNPHLQETTLGWIIGGNVVIGSSNNNNVQNRATCFLNTLEDQMENFWRLEECPSNKITQYSQEELDCIEHFKSTHKRNPDGRFIIHLPFKNNVSKLGTTKHLAIKRLNYLEGRLARDPQLRIHYNLFMKEYEELDHMKQITPNISDTSDSNQVYLPHHCVIKELSTTSKVRVVFDASAKTTSGKSLNDILMTGPKLQDDLFSILIRFRIYQYVLSADIKQMYRQILVAEEDRVYQRIVWRYSRSEPISDYQLNTVTYGTTSAPYLAVQCLMQLADDEKQDFPTASQILKSDFYMDDLLTGTNSMEDALNLRSDLQSLLNRGGFELRKWTSNESNLLPSIHNCEDVSHMINLEKDGKTKLLGLWWNYKNDQLNYIINSQISKSDNINTKRTILSKISQIFDPLGLLCPIIIKVKLIIQKLWQLKHNWDEAIPYNLNAEWMEIINEINEVNKILIPRKVIDIFPSESIELHGFSDASQNAYGACIYIRAVSKTEHVSVHLLCAKSRVAPLRMQTIPRLELCGALLLSKLMKVTQESLKININKIKYWTDSTIVLAWLSTSPNNLKTFVANRVSQIQSLSNTINWHHVKSRDNPADIITRGRLPSQLINDNHWFHGPTWLKKNIINWGTDLSEVCVDIPEMRISVNTTYVHNCDWLNKYSNFAKLQRVTAYCFRFINNTRNKNNRLNGELSTNEIENATKIILKIVQNLSFSIEIKDLQSQNEVNNKSKLKTLNPFLDNDSLIRVGGRLRNAVIPFDKKYPIVLPKHHVTDIIIKQIHENHLHAGNAGTLAAVRETYWPLSGRNQVRKVLHKCIPCYRVKPRELNPFMGDLPASRCEYSFPFVNCGVDYAGPILIKEGVGRGKRNIKAYICVFICFATKAIHLELVGNLTSDNFLNALKRFISRRGLIKNIYSDNATNFVGADKEMKVLAELFESQQFKMDVINQLTIKSIKWHFIPARSPHFNGLAESGVKKVKHHLRRVMGNAVLTFEEVYTLLACIEACLNSRPLLPLTNDPNDLSALTPGHFLIGRPLTSTPDPCITHIAQNRLSRWQHVEQIRQHFWKRWVSEYLTQLQPRPRGNTTDTSNIQPGTLVILKEVNTPPLTWKYGRVVELHPGVDGVTRVVSVRTENGVVKRAVRNICVVPVKIDN